MQIGCTKAFMNCKQGTCCFFTTALYFLSVKLLITWRTYFSHVIVIIFRSEESSLPSRGKTKSSRHSNNQSSEPGSWLGEGRKAITQRAGEFLCNTGQDIDAIGKEYSSLFDGFISQLPVQQHIDLKFLMFRLDFTEFYSRIIT